MEGHRRDDAVVVGGTARQRFHDARGYGRPLGGGEVALAPVEAAHLLFRGDLDAIDGRGFEAYFEAVGADDPTFAVRFLAYADFRARGFYLSPAREAWAPAGADTDGIDFVVYPRGSGPGDGEVGYRVRAVGEREPLPATALGDVMLAVVDEEGEVTYFETERPDLAGESAVEPSACRGTLLADRVVVWEPPAELYHRGIYGQPLSGRDADGTALQLSLVEAAYLAREGALAVDGGVEAVDERGRVVEGDRFGRRLTAYAALREAGLVPKTGLKFGADFRVYADATSIDDLGHSAYLVRVAPAEHRFTPRELALDVRLAHGVRKRMVFALTADTDAVTWLAAGRATP